MTINSLLILKKKDNLKYYKGYLLLPKEHLCFGMSLLELQAKLKEDRISLSCRADEIIDQLPESVRGFIEPDKLTSDYWVVGFDSISFASNSSPLDLAFSSKLIDHFKESLMKLDSELRVKPSPKFNISDKLFIILLFTLILTFIGCFITFIISIA